MEMLTTGVQGGADVWFREGISVGTELDGRALAVSSRYQPSGTRPLNRGALSHFTPVQ